MIDAVTCAHETTAPVETRDPLDAGHGPTTVIAHVCVDCHEQLPAGWGCGDCEFAETRRVCDPVPTRFLVAPCPAHR